MYLLGCLLFKRAMNDLHNSSWVTAFSVGCQTHPCPLRLFVSCMGTGITVVLPSNNILALFHVSCSPNMPENEATFAISNGGITDGKE